MSRVLPEAPGNVLEDGVAAVPSQTAAATDAPVTTVNTHVARDIRTTHVCGNDK